MANEYEKESTIHSLAESMQRGGRSLRNVPGLLALIISEKLWLSRTINGQQIEYKPTEFKKFVEDDYPQGLNNTIQTLEALCRHEPQLMSFLAKAKAGQSGGQVGNTNASKLQVNARGRMVERKDKTTVNNVNTRSDRVGNSKSYAYNRLKSAAFDIDPETREIIGTKDQRIANLYQQVLSKKLSPNAAMIQAGFRRKTAIFYPGDVERTLKALLRYFDIEELRAMLSNDET